MNKEKQIEEMANDLYDNRPYKDLWLEDAEDIAKVLYEAGYRKQSEGEWLPTNLPSYFGGIIYKCSLCGAKDGDHSSILGQYCWRCGAKMKRGK